MLLIILSGKSAPVCSIMDVPANKITEKEVQKHREQLPAAKELNI